MQANAFMMTSSNGNIFRVTAHLCGEFVGPRITSVKFESKCKILFMTLPLKMPTVERQPFCPGWGWRGGVGGGGWEGGGGWGWLDLCQVDFKNIIHLHLKLADIGPHFIIVLCYVSNKAMK